MEEESGLDEKVSSPMIPFRKNKILFQKFEIGSSITRILETKFLVQDKASRVQIYIILCNTHLMRPVDI